jgi:ATP-dependent DNA ligase
MAKLALRAEARRLPSDCVKERGGVQLRSRNDNDFNARYPGLVKALGSMPDETVLDGEIVALDKKGRPSFNALENRGPGEPLHFFTFDLLILRGAEVMAETLVKRRALIEKHVLATLADPIRYSPILEASLPNLIRSVKEQGLEGLVAKRRDSKYEPGERSGAWVKMRVNQAQDFIIGGYTVGGSTFDALIFGYYDGPRLLYAGRTRSGFTPALRESLMRRFRGLEISECPFANLPEARSGRWGEGLTAAKSVGQSRHFDSASKGAHWRYRKKARDHCRRVATSTSVRYRSEADALIR